MIRHAIAAITLATPLVLSGCLAQQYEAECANLGIARGAPNFARCMSYRELVQMQKDEQFQRALLGAALIVNSTQPQPVWAPQPPVVLFVR